MGATIIAWILSFLTSHAPAGRPSPYPAARETKEAAEARYESISKDLAEVVFDPNEVPIFDGDDGRVKTLSVLEGIALFESGGFRKDVDFGLPPHGRGDHGRSVCLMQINVGWGRTPSYNTVQHRYAFPGDPKSEVERGWTATELLKDRKKCFRTGLRMARQSFRACARSHLYNRLAVYTSGSCGRGLIESYKRVHTGLMWLRDNSPGFSDADGLAAFTQSDVVVQYDTDVTSIAAE